VVRGARRRRRDREPSWVTAGDEDLLAIPLGKLGVRIEGSVLEERVARLHRELEARGIDFAPPGWLSTDWFSPDGVPGIAIPFYLAHPRLVRLERAQRLTVEGGSERDGMRLLRHEAGHAIDTAFQLSRRREWREAFGRRSEPYRRSYRVNPWSRDHVQHLPGWYAQSHPADDFAETFAVWLVPRSPWRGRYAGWGARRKLEVVEKMMSEIEGSRPAVRSRERPYSLPRLSQTLGAHYAAKHRQRAIGPGHPFDLDLHGVFKEGRPFTRASSAAAHLRRHSPALVERLSGELDLPPYSARQVIDDMILRTRELGLRLKRDAPPPTLAVIRRAIARALGRLRRGRRSLIR
jgi:hypothetical protein